MTIECTSLKHSGFFFPIGLSSHDSLIYSYSHQSECFESLKKIYPSCHFYIHLYFVCVLSGGHRMFVLEIWLEALYARVESVDWVVKCLACFIREFLMSESFSSG